VFEKSIAQNVAQPISNQNDRVTVEKVAQKFDLIPKFKKICQTLHTIAQ
jgi:hypothetical protein